MASKQGNDGKNTLTGILVCIREINLKASGRIHCRGFDNKSRRPISILG